MWHLQIKSLFAKTVCGDLLPESQYASMYFMFISCCLQYLKLEVCTVFCLWFFFFSFCYQNGESVAYPGICQILCFCVSSTEPSVFRRRVLVSVLYLFCNFCYGAHSNLDCVASCWFFKIYKHWYNFLQTRFLQQYFLSYLLLSNMDLNRARLLITCYLSVILAVVDPTQHILTILNNM